MGGKWAVDARLSNIGSDGYIDRASTRLQSYFLQGAYYGPTTVVKLITFAGKEKTYHAWNGIDKDMLATNRRYNTCGEILDDEGNVVGFYKDQTDNYIQSNYQIHLLQRLGGGWQMNVALHLTKGDGYYEEYKNKRTLEEYGLQPFVVVNPDGTTGEVTKSDLVRRKMMDNIFGGGVFSFDMQHERLQLSVGGAVNSYGGNHFGRVIWVKKYAATDLAPDHEYYRNKGTKNDANIYVKAHWEVACRLFLYGDMQYRRISYRINGANDNWDWNAGAMQSLDVNEKYDFFNPKGGIMYNINKNLNVYASVAVAHKEPTRNNFTDAGLDAKPRPERLIDYEAGVAYNGKRVNASANLYYMRYRDQLVLTGEVNHIGEPLADNVKDSYRAGVELAAGVQIAKWLRWDLNATLSLNRILGYTEYLDNYDTDWNSLYTQTANYLGTTTISFSPSVIAGSLISFNLNGWSAAFQSNYVGKQYLSNSERDDLSLDAYFVNNLRVDYSFKLRSLRTLSVGVAINNIFNAMYCSNGGGSSSYLVSGDAHERYDSAWYFPQAGINFMVGIKIKL
jgi:iron complex outermembrane receptor protein